MGMTSLPVITSSASSTSRRGIRVRVDGDHLDAALLRAGWLAHHAPQHPAGGELGEKPKYRLATHGVGDAVERGQPFHRRGIVQRDRVIGAERRGPGKLERPDPGDDPDAEHPGDMDGDPAHVTERARHQDAGAWLRLNRLVDELGSGQGDHRDRRCIDQCEPGGSRARAVTGAVANSACP